MLKATPLDLRLIDILQNSYLLRLNMVFPVVVSDTATMEGGLAVGLVAAILIVIVGMVIALYPKSHGGLVSSSSGIQEAKDVSTCEDL